MALYDYPRDITAHLKQLETNCGANGYDHSEAPLHGWRAERERASQIERLREGTVARNQFHLIFVRISHLVAALKGSAMER